METAAFELPSSEMLEAVVSSCLKIPTESTAAEPTADMAGQMPTPPEPSWAGGVRPPQLQDDEALLVLSRVAAVGWSVTSHLWGDLVMRVQNRARQLVVENLEKGVKSVVHIPFDAIEVRSLASPLRTLPVHT